MMGMIKKPTFNAYWENDTLMETPGFRGIFSLDEFKLIDAYFQILNPEEIIPNKDPF